MERVLYNCVLGAKPIEKDGHGFYYSDYNNDGSKFYHPYKWHCCTGTFSQVTADYGISSYFHDDDGLYVNLYVPSKVTWRRGSEQISLVQHTNYPHRPTSQIEISVAKATDFAVYLRIPAWAGPKDGGPGEWETGWGRAGAGKVCATAFHVEERRSDRD